MKDHLQQIAGDVTTAFLQGTETLQDLTKKVAEDRSLNPGEIERVAQLVNKEVQIRIYSEEGPSGAIEFDMVDPQAIVADFNGEYPDYHEEKVASAPKTETVKFAEDEEVVSGRKQFQGSFLLGAKSRLELDLGNMEDMMYKSAQDIEAGCDEIYAIVKNAVLSEEATAGEILAFVRQENEPLEQLASSIVTKCMQDIHGERSFDPALLIHSDTVPVDKFRGSKSMVKKLDTLVHQHTASEAHKDGYIQLRESIKYAIVGIDTHMQGEYKNG
jgi:hypothetical protein